METLSLQTISEDTFVERFRPIVNHLDSTRGFDFGDGCCMFETYGKDYEFVTKQNPACIWTIVEGDDTMHIESGWHFVNRFGYLICATPVPEGEDFSVELDVEID